MNEDARKLRILAKQALDAERREEYAIKIAARKRAEFTASLKAYKRKREAERILKKERLYERLAVMGARERLKKSAVKRGWYAIWEVEVCGHSPPCEPEESHWESRRKYITPHKDNEPTKERVTIMLEDYYMNRGNARIRNIGTVWIKGKKR